MCEQEWEWRNDRRSPTDERDPNWQPIDVNVVVLAEKIRLELIEKIAVAFKDVTLGDGVSIHEARAIDDHADSKKARLIDSNTHWQEIPDDWIYELSDVPCVFMDDRGFRHAIPAYMSWCLKYNKTYTNSFDSIADYVSAVENSDELYHKELFKLLDESQRQVISEFLQFLDSVIYSF